MNHTNGTMLAPASSKVDAESHLLCQGTLSNFSSELLALFDELQRLI